MRNCTTASMHASDAVWMAGSAFQALVKACVSAVVQGGTAVCVGDEAGDAAPGEADAAVAAGELAAVEGAEAAVF